MTRTFGAAPAWLAFLGTALWMIVVGLIWIAAATLIGLYLLIRRVVRPNEEWPRDEWLDDDR